MYGRIMSQSLSLLVSKKNPQTPKQTKTCHNDWGDSMQRENALDNILADSNLFPEHANIKTEKISEVPLPYLAAENFKHLHLIRSFFSKPIDVYPELDLSYTHAHLQDLIL